MLRSGEAAKIGHFIGGAQIEDAGLRVGGDEFLDLIGRGLTRLGRELDFRKSRRLGGGREGQGEEEKGKSSHACEGVMQSLPTGG
jgi:hypothetical protein